MASQGYGPDGAQRAGQGPGAAGDRPLRARGGCGAPGDLRPQAERQQAAAALRGRQAAPGRERARPGALPARGRGSRHRRSGAARRSLFQAVQEMVSDAGDRLLPRRQRRRAHRDPAGDGLRRRQGLATCALAGRRASYGALFAEEAGVVVEVADEERARGDPRAPRRRRAPSSAWCRTASSELEFNGDVVLRRAGRAACTPPGRRRATSSSACSGTPSAPTQEWLSHRSGAGHQAVPPELRPGRRPGGRPAGAGAARAGARPPAPSPAPPSCARKAATATARWRRPSWRPGSSPGTSP